MDEREDEILTDEDTDTDEGDLKKKKGEGDDESLDALMDEEFAEDEEDLFDDVDKI